MHNDYSDIRVLTDQPPKWWDENGVPRYCDFHPSECANIYAREAVLFAVTCQACGRPFHVALTRDQMDAHRLQGRTIKDDIGTCDLHYGDPPNIGCCPAGPTMNSEPRYVISYWHKSSDTNYEWVGDPVFAMKVIEPDWIEPHDGPLEDLDSQGAKA